jgi:hypothetical protein
MSRQSVAIVSEPIDSIVSVCALFASKNSDDNHLVEEAAACCSRCSPLSRASTALITTVIYPAGYAREMQSSASIGWMWQGQVNQRPPYRGWAHACEWESRRAAGLGTYTQLVVYIPCI